MLLKSVSINSSISYRDDMNEMNLFEIQFYLLDLLLLH